MNNEIIDKLIKHIENSIYHADRNFSKIKVEKMYRGMSGMNSSRVRHLLNNICSINNTKYLDLGCFRGASVISAAWENNITAYAVDKFNYNPYEPRPISVEGLWPEILRDLNERIKLFKLDNSIEVIISDINKLNKKIIEEPINVCYYDAFPLPINITKAVKAIAPLLDNYCIFIYPNTQNRENINIFEEAFSKRDITIHWNTELKSRVKDDSDTWWNGIKIWILETQLSTRDKNELLKEERIKNKLGDDK